MVEEIGGVYINCATCGKRTLQQYRYWLGDLFFCSWGCMKKYEMKAKNKITSLAGLRKAIEDLNKTGHEIDDGVLVFLIDVLKKIGEFEAGVRERLNFLKSKINPYYSSEREYELRRVLGEGGR